MKNKSFDTLISPLREAILRDEFETIHKDPSLMPANFPDKIRRRQKHMEILIEKHRNKWEANCQAQMQKGRHRTMTVEEMIKDQIRREQPDLDPRKLKKPVGKLFPLLNRFDWRSSNVLPEIRKQEPSACWAAVATETFESSLALQLSNFATSDNESASFIFYVNPVTLNQNSTLNAVKPFHQPNGGRYERAFYHYFKKGIPLDEIIVPATDLSERDAALPPKSADAPQKIKKLVKAVGWNYVNEKPWITPSPGQKVAFENVKRALLEHGPLAVAVAATNEFFNYGHSSERAESRGKTHFKKGVNLRFPADTPVIFENDPASGELRMDIPASFLASTPTADGRQIFQQDPATDDLVLRFGAATAPAFELNPNAPFNPRSAGGDDAVGFSENRPGRLDFSGDQPVRFFGRITSVSVRFPANNGVSVEQDAQTRETVLHFPANTNAKFKTGKNGDLIVRFPADTAPVFDKNTGDSLNHVVLLIGWDDDKEAWIIQNASGTDWGYQCNGPTVRADQNGSQNRGYMYIRYGCNNIGQYAAWIEAPLLDQALFEAPLLDQAFMEEKFDPNLSENDDA